MIAMDLIVNDLVINHAIAWMLTYLLHSTLLLGLAWLVSKPLSRWSVAAEETVWKLALVGALCTASLQLAAGWQPLAGQWRLANLGGVAADAGTTNRVASENVGAGLVPAPALPLKSDAVRARVEDRPFLPVTPATASSLPSASALILGLWALGALVLLAAFGRSYLRLGRRLRSRPRIVGGTIHAQLRELAAEAGLGRVVRLSCSSRLPVPVALGIRAPEICVPPRALAGLTDEQQEGMLAHELAHLARRDPFWLVLGQVLSYALFFQPLNWVARRRLREISEMLSDEWAVARTGRPLSLAGCLAEVAAWSVGTPALPVPGMADRPSNLGRRIRRLLDETRSPENPARRAWLAAAMGVLVIAVAAAAPAVSAARPEPPPAKTPATPNPVAIDVNDATDSPTRLATAEPQGHPGRHHGSEGHKAARDRDDDEDMPDVDVNVDVDDINDQVNDSLQAALDGLDGQLEALSADHQLTAEQQEKLSRDMERKGREIERNLKPRMEKLSRDLAEKSAHMALTPEMQRLAEEMTRLGEQMRPSEKEMARLHAQIDEQMKGMRTDGKLTAEERERIKRQAREMAERAEKMKPTEEQRRQMEQLRAQMEKESARMGERFRAENRDEIEKVQREVREEVEREMQGAREEVRRALDERKALERQDRKDRRGHDRRDQDRRHDAKPEHDDDRDDDGGGSSRQISLRIDPRVRIQVDSKARACPNPKVDVRVDVADSSGR
jgi:beta-lactamase regulating signal transducer with metallopeptidase domain